MCDPVHSRTSPKAARMTVVGVRCCAKPDQGPSQMIDTALSALVRAWATTIVAMLVFVTGLALARAWDSAIYIEDLQETLSLDE
jgi:hypothetical protein